MIPVRPPVVFSSWALGAYLDRWSFVHFGWGFMLASILRLLGISRGRAYLISLTLMLGWELMEWYTGSHDYLTNSLCDVLLASAGFWLMHWLWPRLKFQTDALVATAIIGATVIVKLWSDKG